MEVVASLSQGRTAARQCGLFTRKSVPVIFEPPCTFTAVTHKHKLHNHTPACRENSRSGVAIHTVVTLLCFNVNSLRWTGQSPSYRKKLQ